MAKLTQREKLRNYINGNHSICVWNGEQYLGNAQIVGYRYIKGILHWTLKFYNGFTFNIPAVTAKKNSVQVHLPEDFFDIELGTDERLLMDGFYVDMLDTSPFDAMGQDTIAGYRYLKNELYFTVVSAYGETFELPTNPTELLKFCADVPQHF